MREILIRDIQQYDLLVTTIPSGRRVWLQGVEIPGESERKIRTLPGARLPVVVDCGNGQRVHWVDAASSTKKLTLRVDCALDSVLRTDDRGLWLTSTEDASVHALEIGRVLGARDVLLVGKAANSYVLRRLSTSTDRHVVSVPLVHSESAARSRGR